MIQRLKRDEGASLVLVLIIVTVVAIVLGTTLSYAGTSVRTTINLRDQGSVSYGADAAGQIAVNQLRTDSFNSVTNGCAALSGTTESLSNVYPGVNGAAPVSASVRCTPDPANTGVGGGANSSPGSALLSLGTGAGGEDGIWDGSNNTRTFKVSGGIFSNSNISLGAASGGIGSTGTNNSVLQNVATNSYVFAMGACPYNPGSILVTAPTAVTCNYSTNPVSSSDRRGLDPRLVPGHGTSFDIPAAPPVSSTSPPACTGRSVYNLTAGLYTDASALNALTADATNGATSCSGSVVHFNPGTYYFNFGGSGTHKWTIKSSYVVAGTATSALSTTATPALMAAGTPTCIAPSQTGSTTSTGVLFVFGGDSRMDVAQVNAGTTGNAEICASNAASGPPVAIYGLPTATGSVPAENGCITSTPYYAYSGGVSTRSGTDPNHCALLQTYSDNSPYLTIRGTLYAPKAPVDIVFNQSSAQYFQWGLVARTILIGSTGSATSMDGNVISVPNDAPAPFALPNNYYLDVFACQSGSCPATGTPRLRIKVQTSASTPTTVTVLSWTRTS